MSLMLRVPIGKKCLEKGIIMAKQSIAVYNICNEDYL